MRLHEEFSFYEREIDSNQLTPVSAWVYKFTTRASITFREGNEAVIAMRLSGKQPAFVTIRNSGKARLITTAWCCADIRNSMFSKGKLTGNVYNIRAVNMDTITRQYIKLAIEGGVAIG